MKRHQYTGLMYVGSFLVEFCLAAVDADTATAAGATATYNHLIQCKRLTCSLGNKD